MSIRILDSRVELVNWDLPHIKEPVYVEHSVFGKALAFECREWSRHHIRFPNGGWQFLYLPRGEEVTDEYLGLVAEWSTRIP